MMKLNEIQQSTYDLALKGENIFLTGSGGKGKSVLINKIMDTMEGSCVAVAPTAIASLNINSATIHSQFKFSLGYLSQRKRDMVDETIKELFSPTSNVNTLILEEISMVRSDLFEAIDMALKKSRRSRKPFGGVQTIAVGDFFQLPPVINKNNQEGEMFFKEYKSPFCFSTNSWNESGFTMVELEKVMRQIDEEFIYHLESIRKKTKNYMTSIDYFNRKGSEDKQIDNPIIVCCTNSYADCYNNDFYNSINEKEYIFKGKKTDGYTDQEIVPFELRLKKGVKVMCRANTETMINGETGIIKDFGKDYIIVEKSNKQIATIKKFKWNQLKYELVNNNAETKVAGVYEQYPLVLGYATTIHKTQGMTLDEIVVDVGNGCFASGQLYVALSRCKTIEGFGLLRDLNYKDVIVDSSIQNFYEQEKYRRLNLI